MTTDSDASNEHLSDTSMERSVPRPPLGDDVEFHPQGNRGTWLALFVALIAIAVRVATISWNPERLEQDVDGYLAIAETLYESGTFGISKDQPTAYRPPLYPIVISHLRYEGRAALNVVCSMLTVAIVLAAVPAVRTRWPDLLDFSTERTREKLSLLSAASRRETRMMWGTALFCLASPLSIYYVGYSMTETMCATLLAVALVEITQLARPNPRAVLFIGTRAAARRRTGSAVLLGISLGLASLTRPSCYAVAAVWLAWLAWSGRTNRNIEAEAVRALDPENESGLVPNAEGVWSTSLRLPTIAGVAMLVVISPWVIRNTVLFNRPILTTTHGGYTLLLGNNDAFYDEVVHAPWGTRWTTGQQRWVTQINEEMDTAGLTDEVSRDRWQKNVAWETIWRRPADFAQASLLRFGRFWNVVPQASDSPRAVLWSVGCFYAVAWTLAIIGVIVAWRERLIAFVPAALLPLTFAAVHLLYWSNARMRLPVEPAVFLFAGIGVDTLLRVVRGRVP